jgi:hypothetical protein
MASHISEWAKWIFATFAMGHLFYMNFGEADKQMLDVWERRDSTICISRVPQKGKYFDSFRDEIPINHHMRVHFFIFIK